ncbi:MAG: polysaccharide deacetylase family protein [FCB group bacterium]|nr:polysaccharide deacetylase family protein [FCB group bacterium]
MKLESKAKVAGKLGKVTCLLVSLSLLFLAVTTTTAFSKDNKSKTKPTAKKKLKEMCITFNELPVAKSFGEVDRQAITYLILDALKKHKVKTIGFVVGDQIGDSYDILGEWLNDGNILGNMTYSNQDLNELGIEQFISDIKAGHDALEPMLSGFGQKKRYFRYPYLHYGNTVESKKQIKLYLNAHHYITVPATIIIEDYLYNLSLEKMGKIPDTNKYYSLLNEYINHVVDEIQNSENLSMQILKRPCRQILQLRANRLNAVALDELLTTIENMGYQFISVKRALKDKLYSQPEAYFGTRGVSYLEMIKESNPDYLPAE